MPITFLKRPCRPVASRSQLFSSSGASLCKHHHLRRGVEGGAAVLAPLVPGVKDGGAALLATRRLRLCCETGMGFENRLALRAGGADGQGAGGLLVKPHDFTSTTGSGTAGGNGFGGHRRGAKRAGDRRSRRAGRGRHRLGRPDVLAKGAGKLAQDGDTDDDAATAGANVLAETFHLAHYKVASATGAGQMFGAHRS